MRYAIIVDYFALRRDAVLILPFVFGFLIDAIEGNQSAASVEEIQSIASKLRLFPQIIKTIPSNIVEVTYGERRLKLGDLINADDIMDEPLVSWPSKEGAVYIMILSGPDASYLDSKKNSYEHWIIGNIPGTDLANGDKLSDYVGLTKAAYCQGTTHRLVFYVFEQPRGKKMKFEGALIKKKDTGRIRGMLSMEDLVLRYDLGDPYAVHFFEVFFNKTKL
nr:PREDICTED: protein D1-like isoform X1 [Bemisia tabaci]